MFSHIIFEASAHQDEEVEEDDWGDPGNVDHLDSMISPQQFFKKCPQKADFPHH